MNVLTFVSKTNRVEIFTCNLYLCEYHVLNSSFSSLHSSIQDTEIFDDLNSALVM